MTDDKLKEFKRAGVRGVQECKEFGEFEEFKELKYPKANAFAAGFNPCSFAVES
jgi:hypothetical protein